MMIETHQSMAYFTSVAAFSITSSLRHCHPFHHSKYVLYVLSIYFLLQIWLASSTPQG